MVVVWDYVCAACVLLLRATRLLPAFRHRVVFKIVELVHQSLAGAVPRTLLTTVVFCLKLVIARCDPIQTTCGSWLCHELTINSRELMMPPADQIREQNEQDPGRVVHTRQALNDETPPVKSHACHAKSSRLIQDRETDRHLTAG